MQDEMNDLVNPYYVDPEDWVRVTRCKDCRYYTDLIPNTEPICLKRCPDFKPDDYCSKGVRNDA